MNDLHQAAAAVLDRWDSPTWEWAKQGPTADLMANLRAALTRSVQKPVEDSPQEAWPLRVAAESALAALVSQLDGRADAITALRDGLAQTQSEQAAAAMTANGKSILSDPKLNIPNFFFWNDIHRLAVKQMGKPAVYIDNRLDLSNAEENEIWLFIIEKIKSLYESRDREYYAIMSGLTHGGMVFFESKQDQYDFYRIFEQSKIQNSGIFACCYDAFGQCETQNK